MPKNNAISTKQTTNTQSRNGSQGKEEEKKEEHEQTRDKIFINNINIY